MIPITPEGSVPTTDGRATRWAGHRTSRRSELVRAARRVVHHRGPDVSMEEIAAEIGTSKSILYRYFSDKTGLQTAIGQEVLARMGEALEEAASSAGGPRERITAMVSVYLEMVDSSPHVYAFLTRTDGPTAGAVRGFAAEVGDLVVDSLLPALRGDTAGADLPDPDRLAVAQLWAAGVVGLVRGAAERWLSDRLAGPDGVGAEGAGAALDPVTAALAAMTREELATHLSNWLWDGAVGVTRRARRGSA